MALVFLGLGTNLGNKEKNLQDAITYISDEVGKVISTSSFYKSEPWGFESDNHFLNAVVAVESHLSPTQILENTQCIEKLMGRTEKTSVSYSDRIIDIDMLLYDNEIIDTPKLKIPHPLLHERDFVLIPLAEIAPKLIHPTLHKNIEELKTDLLSK